MSVGMRKIYECYSGSPTVLHELLGADLSSSTLEQAEDYALGAIKNLRFKMRHDRYFRARMKKQLPTEITISELIYEDEYDDYPISETIVQVIPFDIE